MTARTDRQIELGLLHTAPGLADSFERLAAEIDPSVRLLHVVDSTLLRRATQEGVTEDLDARTARHVGYLAGEGVDAVLVTCSSIGECADLAATDAPVPVLRVDRPMAVRAVEAARQALESITVLATLSSTLGPTRRLLEAEAARSGSRVPVDAVVVPEAAAARSAGDGARHDALVRAAVAEQAGVVVLAQASMAAALTDGETAGRVVLSSPLSGLREALAVAGTHGRG